MKLLRIWLLFIVLLVAFPVTAGAHVALTSTSPADGETVTTEVDSIEITFSGEILPMSKLVIIDEEGVETAPLETIVDQASLKAKLAAPLMNGTYDVKWNIVAQDGHSLEGGIQFTVAVEEEAPAEEPVEEPPAEEPPAVEPTTEEPQVEEPPVSESTPEPTEPEPAQEEAPAAPDEQDQQGQFREYVPFIAAAGVLILAVFIFLLLRPKRKS